MNSFRGQQWVADEIFQRGQGQFLVRYVNIQNQEVRLANVEAKVEGIVHPSTHYLKSFIS